jgi:hypothetical protein
MRVYNSYSGSMYDRTLLRARVKSLVQRLPEIMARTNADSIFVTGKSGLGIAFPLLYKMDVKIVTVRKPGEESHGTMFEGIDRFEPKRYLFLDDFVSSGETVERVLTSVYKREGKSEFPQMVGIVEWDAYEGGHKDKERMFQIWSDYESHDVAVAAVRIPMFQTRVKTQAEIIRDL